MEPKTGRIDPARNPRKYIYTARDGRWRPVAAVYTRNTLALLIGFVAFVIAVALGLNADAHGFTSLILAIAVGLAITMIMRPVLTHGMKITPEDERGLTEDQFADYRREFEKKHNV